MAKDSRVPEKPPVDAALREAFKAVEAQPVPARIVEHVAKLAPSKRRTDTRS